MKYSVIVTTATSSHTLETEIMFNLASERVNGTELIRFDIKKVEDEKSNKKNIQSAMRLFRKLKFERKIQFYANDVSFSNNSTEAAFLYNKYPELFVNREVSNFEKEVIYVKL